MVKVLRIGRRRLASPEGGSHVWSRGFAALLDASNKGDEGSDAVHPVPDAERTTWLALRREPIKEFETLQAIRGLAALAVVAFHQRELFADKFYYAWLGRFYLGVDVFFVISGFVIAWSTKKPTNADVGGFVIRRLFRVVPLSWLITGLILLIDHGSLVRVVRSLLFYPELQPSTYLINPAQWTISFELMFYALFALALSISHRYRCEICLVIVAVLSLVDLADVFGEARPALLNYVYLLEFAAGVLLGRMLLGLSAASATSSSMAIRRTASSLAALCLGVYLLLLYGQSGDDRIFSLAAVSLMSGIFLFESTWKMTVPRVLLFLGELSFAIYISQHFIFMFVNSRLFWTPLYRTWLYQHSAGGTRFALILVVLLAFSCLFHFTVEQRGIEVGRRLARVSRRSSPRSRGVDPAPVPEAE